MLVLTRKEGQQVTITTPSGEELVITITEGNCRLGIEAPRDYRIERDDMQARPGNR